MTFAQHLELALRVAMLCRRHRSEPFGTTVYHRDDDPDDPCVPMLVCEFGDHYDATTFHTDEDADAAELAAWRVATDPRNYLD